VPAMRASTELISSSAMCRYWNDHSALPISLVTPLPASLAEIKRAHAPSYVDGILSCVLPNGFRGRQKDVADSLPWTCGSLLSAARGALNSRGVACSPTSGFHHAGYDSGYGYCTFFNGLMVTALAIKGRGQGWARGDSGL
jgi:acetoin utilization deacetylase AcuC-like enzyme